MEENTGLNGHTLEECLNKSLSEMCDDPRYIEDLQVIAGNFTSKVVDFKKQIYDLTILLEHYEKIQNKQVRKQILAMKDEIDNMY